MRKSAAIAFIVFSASLIGIAPAQAVTCPTGTYVSLSEPTKCTASPATATPLTKVTVKTCSSGTLNTNTGKCDIPGGWVEPTTYTSTDEKKENICSSGSLGTDGKCHTTLNPPVLIATEFRFTTYSCPTQYHPNLSGTKCTGVGPAVGTSIDAVASKPPCSTGYSEVDGVCSKYKTEDVSDPTSTVVGYYCDGIFQTSTTCSVAGYTSAATTADPTISYTGTCPTYYTFSTTAGTCSAYTFAPDNATATNIYKCLVTSYGVTFTAYFNYDASINAPVGVSRTCTQQTNAETRSGIGVYLCTTISNSNGITISFVSETDVTGATTANFTQCDWIPSEELDFDATLDDYTLSSDYCINTPTFESYLNCIGIYSA